MGKGRGYFCINEAYFCKIFDFPADIIHTCVTVSIPFCLECSALNHSTNVVWVACHNAHVQCRRLIHTHTFARTYIHTCTLYACKLIIHYYMYQFTEKFNLCTCNVWRIWNIERCGHVRVHEFKPTYYFGQHMLCFDPYTCLCPMDSGVLWRWMRFPS